MRKLFLASEDASQNAAGNTSEQTATGFSTAENTSENPAGTALQGHEDVIQVHVTVAVLILDDSLETTENLRDKGSQRGTLGAEVQFGKDIGVENASSQRSHRARRCISFSGEKILDKIDAPRLCSRLGKAAEDGIGQATEDLILDIGRNGDIAGRILHLLEDDVTEVHNISNLV